jgi:para-aminobenzoate synthetase/4-amino-4-deoxychorismate lyase
LELSRGRACALTHAALGVEPADPLSVVVARQAIDAGDPFLRYKTTRRAVYDHAFAAAAAAGHDEAVFVNRDGLVTEACRSNVFLERDDKLVTPPLANGLLPGILRQALLERGEAVEAEFTLDDLRRAERWHLGNSLRGLRRARLG